MPKTGYDLRERKRTKTRLMIQDEAYRLFAEKGYDNTTVDDIAFAAAVSARTVFRYFPTKEDIVLWDEYEPMAEELFAARPAGESASDTLRAIVHESVTGLYKRAPDQMRLRARLLATVPELRASLMQQQVMGGELFAAAVMARGGAKPRDELGLRALPGAFGAAIMTAIDVWQKDDGTGDLPTLIDQAIDSLVDQMRALQ